MPEPSGRGLAHPGNRAARWRACVVAFVVAVASATAVVGVWHVDHDADPQCAVCKLGHEPLADLAADTPGAPPETAAGVPSMLARWVLAVTTAPVPARGPPLA